MKKFSIYFAIVFAVVFSGCAGSQPSLSKQEKFEANPFKNISLKMESDKPMNQVKIFIDNSADLRRNAEVKEHLLSLISAPDALRELDIETKVEHRKAISWRTGSSFIFMEDIPVITEKCMIMCDKLNSDASNIIRTKNGFKINNINSDLDIASAYSNIINKYVFLVSNGITPKFAVQAPIYLKPESFKNNMFEVDYSFLDNFTMKSSLEDKLSKKGFKIVNKKEDADFSFIVKNLGFGRLESISPFLDKHIDSKSSFETYGNLGVLRGNMHTVNGGSSLTGARIAGDLATLFMTQKYKIM